MKILSVRGVYALEATQAREDIAPVAKAGAFRFHATDRCPTDCPGCAARVPAGWWWCDNEEDVARAAHAAERLGEVLEIGDDQLRAKVDELVAARKAQPEELERVIEMKVRVKLARGCGDTTAQVGATVAKQLQKAFPASLKKTLEYESLAVLEHREVKLPEEWVSIRGLFGADRIPADVAKILRRAMAKAVKNGATKGWQTLEPIAADYLAGPGDSSDDGEEAPSLPGLGRP